MSNRSTLILKRSEVARLLDLDSCIPAVEDAFRSYREGLAPGVLSTHAPQGAFHVKAAGLSLKSLVYAAKVNANFPGNRSKYNLPTIQGVIVLCDAENGYPLAVLDSIEITILRTGAATAVAARYLAPSDADTVMIWGCGNQGRIQLRSLTKVRSIRKALVFDQEEDLAKRFAREMSAELNIEVERVTDPGEATRRCRICVTCTTSRAPFLKPADVGSGTFIAAVGADNPEKHELDPALFARNKIVVDNLEQCSAIGDLHHALDQGAIRPENVHAELADIITGRKPGRESDDEIIIFDSTGLAFQDVAAAAIVYEKAVARNEGLFVDFQG